MEIINWSFRKFNHTFAMVNYALMPVGCNNMLGEVSTSSNYFGSICYPGTEKGAVEWKNDGRDGSATLPKKDDKGRPITYYEYDINPAPQHGAGRGKERMVIGTDGRAYYTRDHYKTLVEFGY